MKKLTFILLLIIPTIKTIAQSVSIDKIDNYIADTTLSIWAEKFNSGIIGFNNSIDTIILGVDNLPNWSIKTNKFIDSVSLVGRNQNLDTIGYGTDNFETWRNKFNYAVDSSSSVWNYSAQYYQVSEGGDLLDSLGGIDLPYVSGFGVNQIFDLSVRSDTKFNKNSYTGNSFGLPEYYNFPYDTLYYDSVNPYHWKIKDFHYRHYEQQADSLTNIGFAQLTYANFGYGANCTTSGTAYVNNTTAYGEWEFDIYKAFEEGQLYIPFISDGTGANISNDGYVFFIRNTEAIWLRKSGSSVVTLFSTASDFIDIQTYYRIKITRNSYIDEFVTGAIGTFAMYIKGGSFGSSFVLITVSGGSNPVTDNTFTASTYTVLDFGGSADFSDVVRNYYINDVIQDFNNLTETTGVYTIDNLKSADELLLYNSEQTEPTLTKIKSYINLISETDFYINE